jgi:hypothetical protein
MMDATRRHKQGKEIGRKKGKEKEYFLYKYT